MKDTPKKVAFHTLGCKLNFSETSTIARQFEQGGFVRTERGQRADICVINTCSVTEHADKKCRSAIRRIIRDNPGAIVAVTGCYAQLKPERIAEIEGVGLVISNNDKGSLYDKVVALGTGGASGAAGGAVQLHTCQSEELVNFFSSFSAGDRTRSFLKVQDGCDYKCSYCTIPAARGASRNIPIAEVVAQAEKIAAAGQKEIVITGINTGDFGRTTGESFAELLRELDKVEGIERYRISSIEPNLLTDRIIDFTASSDKFQPHFHIPLQSGSDRILGLMRRRYNTELFAERIAAVRARMHDAFIGIDVIAGFPGETEEDFEDTYRFLETLRPSFIHVFPYSARPGTPAAGFDGRVHPAEMSRRVEDLTALSMKLHTEFHSLHVGKTAHVLWESTRRGGEMTGYTANYIKVAAPYDRTLINRITPVRIGKDFNDGVAKGIIIFE